MKLQNYIDKYNQTIKGLDVSPKDWSKGFNLYLEQQKLSKTDIEFLAVQYQLTNLGLLDSQ